MEDRKNSHLSTEPQYGKIWRKTIESFHGNLNGLYALSVLTALQGCDESAFVSVTSVNHLTKGHPDKFKRSLKSAIERGLVCSLSSTLDGRSGGYVLQAQAFDPRKQTYIPLHEYNKNPYIIDGDPVNSDWYGKLYAYHVGKLNDRDIAAYATYTTYINRYGSKNGLITFTDDFIAKSSGLSNGSLYRIKAKLRETKFLEDKGVIQYANSGQFQTTAKESFHQSAAAWKMWRKTSSGIIIPDEPTMEQEYELSNLEKFTRYAGSINKYFKPTNLNRTDLSKINSMESVFNRIPDMDSFLNNIASDVHDLSASVALRSIESEVDRLYPVRTKVPVLLRLSTTDTTFSLGDTVVDRNTINDLEIEKDFNQLKDWSILKKKTRFDQEAIGYIATMKAIHGPNFMEKARMMDGPYTLTGLVDNLK